MHYQIYHFSNIDSTNTWALQNPHLCPFEKITLVHADRQTKGRGRFNRKWLSEEIGNLYASFCVWISEEKGVQIPLVQVMALSIAEAIEETTGLLPKIKWPNDLLLENKKVAGILTETKNIEGKIFYVIGVGINVLMNEEAFTGIDRPATSLSIEGKSREKELLDNFFKALQKHFNQDYTLFLEEGYSHFLPKVQSKLVHVYNKPISFHEGGQTIKGLFHSLNQDGSLNLQLSDGTVRRCFSGTIE